MKAVMIGMTAGALFGGVDAAFAEKPVYAGRSGIEETIDKYCFSAANESNIKSLSTAGLYKTFNKMSGRSETGKTLAKNAAELDIVYCHYGEQDRSVGASYRQYFGMVQMDMEAGDAYNGLTIAHETLHGVQGGQPELRISWDKSLENNLRTALYQEAAASIVEVVVAFEAMKKGDLQLWRYIFSEPLSGTANWQSEARAFQKSFNGFLAQGIPEREAKERAASVAFEEKFKNKSWREFYLTRQIAYLGMLYDMRYFDMADKSKPMGAEISNEVVSAAGWLAADYSLTRYAREPTLAQIFDGLPDLRHAFDALEFARLRRAYGAEDIRVVESRRFLETSKNPYLDIDWGAVKKAYDADKTFTPIDRIMNRALVQKAPKVSGIGFKTEISA